MRKKLKYWAPVIFVFVTIVALSFIWYLTFPPSSWAEKPNYLMMYFEFVAARPIDALLTVSTGPGGTVSWVFVPVYLGIMFHIAVYTLGRRHKQQYTIVNKYYLGYLVVLALFAVTFQNASQHYDWYWNPELDAPGYVDTWTHITSPWLLGALFLPFGLERFVGWHRKSYWFFIFSILAIIALGWEIAETLDVYMRPQSASYFNYPMDSLKDLIMGAGIGTVLSCWIYERLVMDLTEEAESTE